MIDPGKQGFPVAAGIFLGLGLGGFFDGIVLHQILQWHHMLTSAGYPADSVHNQQVNTFLGWCVPRLDLPLRGHRLGHSVARCPPPACVVVCQVARWNDPDGIWPVQPG